jgi:uncharacterized membrane protein/thiol-disulfide isomerase/thioredoxin
MALSALGVALSLYLGALHLAIAEDSQGSVCEFASFLSCDRVLSSSYASVGPLPLAVIGSVGFSSLFAAALWRFLERSASTAWLPTMLFYGAAFGFGYEVAITVVAAIDLRVACPGCLVVLGVITAVTLIAWRLRRVATAQAPPSAVEWGRRKHVVTRLSVGGITAVAVLLTVAGFQISRGLPSDDSTLPLALGQQAPVFQARDLHGQWHRLDDYVGTQPLLIEFLWTFCRHCRAIAPMLRELAAAHEGRLTVLSIAGDRRERADLVRDFVGEFSHGWPYLLADTSVLVAYGVSGYPTFVVIDRAGRVRSTIRGEVSRERLERAIATAFGALGS